MSETIGNVVFGLMAFYYMVVAILCGWRSEWSHMLGALCASVAFVLPLCMAYTRESRIFLTVMFVLLSGLGALAMGTTYDAGFAIIAAFIGIVWLACIALEVLYEHILRCKIFKR